MGLPGLNQYKARINVSCSRTQRSDVGEVRTRAPWSRVKYSTTEPLPSHKSLERSLSKISMKGKPCAHPENSVRGEVGGGGGGGAPETSSVINIFYKGAYGLLSRNNWTLRGQIASREASNCFLRGVCTNISKKT